MESCQIQKVRIIQPNEKFVIPNDTHTRVERFSLIENGEKFAGQRLVIMSEVTTKTLDGRSLLLNVAIASFTIGSHYEQDCDLIFSPVDQCSLSIIGPPLPIQIQYTQF